MKKIYLLSASLLALGIISCQKTETTAPLQGEEMTVSLSLGLPDEFRPVTSPATKVGGGTDGEYVSSALGGYTNLRTYGTGSNNYISVPDIKWTVDIYYGHYDDASSAANAIHPYHWDETIINNSNPRFIRDIKLAKGEPYTLIAKAEFSASHQEFNDEAEDCYYKVHKFWALKESDNTSNYSYHVGGSNEQTNITIDNSNNLESLNGLVVIRPHGKLRVIADDFVEFTAIEAGKSANPKTIQTIKVDYTKYEGQNVSNISYTTGTTENPLKSWPGIDLNSDNDWSGDGGEACIYGKTLFVDYLKGGSDFENAALMYRFKVTITFSDNTTKEILINNDIPIKVNALTTIRGRMLCEDESAEVVISLDDYFQSGTNGHKDINM